MVDYHFQLVSFWNKMMGILPSGLRLLNHFLWNAFKLKQKVPNISIIQIKNMYKYDDEYTYINLSNTLTFYQNNFLLSLSDSPQSCILI